MMICVTVSTWPNSGMIDRTTGVGTVRFVWCGGPQKRGILWNGDAISWTAERGGGRARRRTPRRSKTSWARWRMTFSRRGGGGIVRTVPMHSGTPLKVFRFVNTIKTIRRSQGGGSLRKH